MAQGIDDGGDRPASALSVMLVEDHAMVAEGLELAVSAQDDLDFVGWVSSVEEGVELATRTRPDVAVVDYRLPDGTGADATVSILERSPGTGVILFTAMDGQAVLSRAIEAGASGFLRKTEPLEEILRAIRMVGSGDTYFSPEILSSLVETLRYPKQAVGATLTPRELEVLQLLSRGRSTDEIVKELVVSPHTARNHIRNILNKLNAHSKLEAVTIAAREGIVTLE